MTVNLRTTDNPLSGVDVRDGTPLQRMSGKLAVQMQHQSPYATGHAQVGSVEVGFDRGYIALEFAMADGVAIRALLSHSEARLIANALVGATLSKPNKGFITP